MGIRETLNENPRLTTGVTAGIIGVTLLWILWSTFGGGGGVEGGSGGGKAFFTDDDGKTWFADDATKIPPFDRSGKQAVRAHVYKCDGKTFVNHMERYTPDAKKKLEAAMSQGSGAIADPTMMDTIQATGLEYKSPGQANWIKMNDPRVGQVLQPKCSKPEEAEPVFPD